MFATSNTNIMDIHAPTSLVAAALIVGLLVVITLSAFAILVTYALIGWMQ